MKEGNEEARQTEGDNGQGDRGRKTRRARAKLADREGRAARGTANGRRKGERRKERGWTASWRGNRRVYDGERGRKEGKGMDRERVREKERNTLGIDARREGEEERE